MSHAGEPGLTGVERGDLKFEAVSDMTAHRVEGPGKAMGLDRIAKFNVTSKRQRKVSVFHLAEDLH